MYNLLHPVPGWFDCLALKVALCFTSCVCFDSGAFDPFCVLDLYYL